MMKEYPSKDGKWSLADLEMLGKALGYHPNVFYENTATLKEKQFIRYEDLNLLLEGNDLYPVLHETYNHQDGGYNLKVVSKAIQLLYKRYMSFAMIKVARVSFQTYERADHTGLEDKYVLKALKLCGRSIAPTRLKQLLKHMDRLVPDCLMMYEFLDLVASADLLETVKKEMPPKKVVPKKVNQRQFYDLCDFNEELCTEDDRCYRHLEKQFEELLKTIPVHDPTIGQSTKSQPQWVTPPLANRTVRKEMASKSRLQGEHLNNYLNTSNTEVKKCMCSGTCPCANDCSRMFTPDDKEIKNRRDGVGPCYAGVVAITTEDKIKDHFEIKESTPIEKIRIKSPLVTQKDREETLRNIQDIQWEMATQKQSSKRKQLKNFSP